MPYVLSPPDYHEPEETRPEVLLDYIQTTVQVQLPAFYPIQAKKSYVKLLNKLWTINSNDVDFRKRRKRITQCSVDFFCYWKKSTEEIQVKPIRCMDPICPICHNAWARKYRTRLEFHITRMKSPKFWTFTIQNTTKDPRTARSELIANFKKLRHSKLWKETVKGGVWIVETTRNTETNTWHPHIHAILDTDFLPWEQVKDLWKKITKGSFIVHYRPLENARKCATYLLKYLQKGPGLIELPQEEFEAAIQATVGARKYQTFGTAYCRSLKELFALEPDPDLRFLGRYSRRWYWTNLPLTFSEMLSLASQTMSQTYASASSSVVSLDAEDPPEIYHGPGKKKPPG